MIKIALIHPQPIYRKGLSLLLKEGIDRLEVVATASSHRDLVDRFPEIVIDVIIWDIPGHHVLSMGSRILKECYPISKLLVLVSSSNAVYRGLLETLGANAVITTNCRSTELWEAIQMVHESYAPPPSSNHVQEPEAKTVESSQETFEFKILRWLMDGLSTNAIADLLDTSPNRVTDSLVALKKKYQVDSDSKLLEQVAKQTTIFKSNSK